MSELQFSDVIASIKLPEASVTIPTAGDLIVEHAELDRQLTRNKTWKGSDSLSDVDPRIEIAEKIRALEERIRASEISFQFRALGQRKYRELVELHQSGAKAGERWNTDTFPPALIAASAVNPRMTPADVSTLIDHLSEGQVAELFNVAYTVNEGTTRVPFSSAAYELTPG